MSDWFAPHSQSGHGARDKESTPEAGLYRRFNTSGFIGAPHPDGDDLKRTALRGFSAQGT
jgi:hypothetical protein